MIDALNDITGFVGTAASGGLLGFLGVGIKSFFKTRMQKMAFDHERDMRKSDIDELRLQHSHDVRTQNNQHAHSEMLANLEAETARDIAQSKTQSDSYSHDQATYSTRVLDTLTGFPAAIIGFMLACIDVLRGLMRPGLTTYLIVVESILAYQLLQLVKHALTHSHEAQLINLLVLIVHSLVFLSATAVTWWFGSRPQRD